MKYYHLIFTAVLFLAIHCEDDQGTNTDKNTYYDDISDICYVYDHFYSTNYDLSGHSGSQIDLIRFSTDGAHLDDAFDLDMNGQGYLAMTTDGHDIYMQSRANAAIIKSSLVGEKAYMKWDTLDVNRWFQSGICYNPSKDSLVLLYRDLENPQSYKVRAVSKQHPCFSGSEYSFSVNFIDTTSHGIYTLTLKDSKYYMLGVDTLLQDKLLILDPETDSLTFETIPDSTVVGLAFKGDDLYLSYRDRRIEMWDSY